MASQVNPRSWLSMDLDNSKQRAVFMNQLVSYLTDNLSVSGLASILNGSKQLNYTALTVSLSSLGPLSASQAINCASATSVAIELSFSASITLTLNNLGSGVPVALAVASTGAFTLKLAATLPGGTAYTLINYFTGGSQVNLLTTGWVSGGAASRIFVGTTNLDATGHPILQVAFV